MLVALVGIVAKNKETQICQLSISTATEPDSVGDQPCRTDALLISRESSSFQSVTAGDGEDDVDRGTRNRSPGLLSVRYRAAGHAKAYLLVVIKPSKSLMLHNLGSVGILTMWIKLVDIEGTSSIFHMLVGLPNTRLYSIEGESFHDAQC